MISLVDKSIEVDFTLNYWSPSIFGAIIVHSMDGEYGHAYSSVNVLVQAYFYLSLDCHVYLWLDVENGIALKSLKFPNKLLVIPPNSPFLALRIHKYSFSQSAKTRSMLFRLTRARVTLCACDPDSKSVLHEYLSHTPVY